MPPFEWKDEYLIGDRHVDDQHQMLLSLANLLHDAVIQGTDKMVVDQAFEILRFYTEQHFADEEELMAQRQCYGLETHKSQHRELTIELRQLWQSNLDGEPETVGKVLSDWVSQRLIPHFTGPDQDVLQKENGA
ncbi:MAG: hypothetical protein MI741_23760 [Rhodospirillales bacterium]|nr:hypothetical protein [Rhodospirillales bacterium]